LSTVTGAQVRHFSKTKPSAEPSRLSFRSRIITIAPTRPSLPLPVAGVRPTCPSTATPGGLIMPVWAATAARALHTYIALLADLNDSSFFLPSERDGDADALPLPTMRVPEWEGRQGAAPSIHRSTQRDGTPFEGADGASLRYATGKAMPRRSSLGLAKLY